MIRADIHPSTRALLANPRVQALLQSSRDRQNAETARRHYEALAAEAADRFGAGPWPDHTVQGTGVTASRPPVDARPLPGVPVPIQPVAA